MRDMMNVAFQQAWFGPFSIPQIYPKPRCEEHAWPFAPEDAYVRPECAEHVGEVYDIGPLDGLKTTSMWAQSFAQIPIRNYAQNPMLVGSRRKTMGEKPVFCYPGNVPVPTGIPGQSKCVPYSSPSTMIGPQPSNTVSTTIPPSYPQARTFPVRPFYGWDRGF